MTKREGTPSISMDKLKIMQAFQPAIYSSCRELRRQIDRYENGTSTEDEVQEVISVIQKTACALGDMLDLGGQ